MYYENIRNERIKHKESQETIAELLQTTQQHYSSYERGDHELPIRHLITLCKHWKVSAYYLLGLRP